MKNYPLKDIHKIAYNISSSAGIYTYDLQPDFADSPKVEMFDTPRPVGLFPIRSLQPQQNHRLRDCTLCTSPKTGSKTLDVQHSTSKLTPP